MSAQIEEFFEAIAVPSNFEESKYQIKKFCERHSNQKVVLVTSGGTTVPLEQNVVRYLDNFSAGTRGAASTEYFLYKGYAVIFLHRLNSVEPFVRHLGGKSFLDMLETNGSGLAVKEECVNMVASVLGKYRKVQAEGRLLSVPFTTLADYLWLLRAASECLAPLGPRAMLYLAAAVSDFYVPATELPEHKMQSEAGPVTISLKLVPKILAPLVNLWVPNAFIVSFKLETDDSILVKKARCALAKYKHKLVIANLLTTRKTEVIMVTADSEHKITINQVEAANGMEIEGKIVDNLVPRHEKFIATFKYLNR